MLRASSVLLPQSLHWPIDKRRVRAVEVSDRWSPLIDVLIKLNIDIVSIEGTMLPSPAKRRDLYVCASLPNRQDALASLLVLITESMENHRLRDTITDLGHPQLAQVGNKVLLWFPELRGCARTIH